jgi:hypothetical protein
MRLDFLFYCRTPINDNHRLNPFVEPKWLRSSEKTRFNCSKARVDGKPRIAIRPISGLPRRSVARAGEVLLNSHYRGFGPPRALWLAAGVFALLELLSPFACAFSVAGRNRSHLPAGSQDQDRRLISDQDFFFALEIWPGAF